MLYVICSQFKGGTGFERTKCLVRAFVKPSRFWHFIATVDGVVASRLKQQRRMVDQVTRQCLGSRIRLIRHHYQEGIRCRTAWKHAARNCCKKSNALTVKLL